MAFLETVLASVHPDLPAVSAILVFRDYFPIHPATSRALLKEIAQDMGLAMALVIVFACQRGKAEIVVNL
eukprot:ANDGO_02779.mRNA.1 hypothetical protein